MMCIGRPPLKARVAVVITTLVLTATAAWAEPQGTWSSTGSMAVGRFVFTATTLQNGKVLVAGGDTPGDIITNKAELYDPTTGTFTPTGNMHAARVAFSATRLPNGKVLVEGGASNTVGALASAELYDASTGTWTLTGSMPQRRRARILRLWRYCSRRPLRSSHREVEGDGHNDDQPRGPLGRSPDQRSGAGSRGIDG